MMDNKIQNKNNIDVVDAPTVTEIRKYAHDALMWIKLGIVLIFVLVFLIGTFQAVWRGETINIAPLETAVKNVDSETWQILNILKELQNNSTKSIMMPKIQDLTAG
jgi:hypothetical protein